MERIIDLRKPNLREAEVGTTVITSGGHKWQLTERKDGKESWMDLQTNLTWLDKEDGNFNHYEAMEKFGDKIPTKEMWEEAEKHNVREVLPNMDYWFWSSSVHPDYSDYAYVLNGYNGDIYDYYRSDYSSYSAVRCVR